MTGERLALVTGATGFVGRHLALRLVNERWRVRVVVRDAARLDPALADRAEIVVGDLADLPGLERAVGAVDVVFHCAADVRTWGALSEYEAANVTGVANLVAAVERANPALHRFVHLSTLDVYGFPKEPQSETGPTPRTGFGYGDTKIAGEALVRRARAERGLRYTIFRPGNIIGPFSPFITRIGAELANGLMLKVDGGRAHAGLLDVDHLTEAMIWAAEAERAVGEIYNIRDVYDADWALFLRTLKAGIGGRGLVVNLPFAVAEAAASTLEGVHRAILPAREPLLHRLIVRMFGRTCGHDVSKLRAARPDASGGDFEAMMARSVRWFLGPR